MDILDALLGLHEAGMDRVCEDVGVRRRQVFREVLAVQHLRELRPSILPVGTQVLIELVQRGELGVARRALVGVGAEADDAHFALLGGLLEQRQEVAREDDMTDVVHGHVTVDAVVGELKGHDPARGVVDQDVDSVCFLGDCGGGLRRCDPVCEIALDPSDLLCCGLVEVGLDGGQALIDAGLRVGNQEDLVDVL